MHPDQSLSSHSCLESLISIAPLLTHSINAIHMIWDHSPWEECSTLYLQYVSLGNQLLPCTCLFLRRLRSIHSLKLKHSTMTLPIGYLNFLFGRKLNSACSSRSATAKDTNIATEFLNLKKKKMKQQKVSSLESLLGTHFSPIAHHYYRRHLSVVFLASVHLIFFPVSL